MALTHIGHHLVESRLQETEVAAVVDAHGGVEVSFSHLCLRKPELFDGVGDGGHHADETDRTEGECGDRHPQDRALQTGGVGVDHADLLTDHQRDDDAEGSGHADDPEQDDALGDAGGRGALGVVGHRGNGDGAEDFFRLHVAQHAGDEGADERTECHDDGRLRRLRQAEQGEDRAAEQPQGAMHLHQQHREAEGASACALVVESGSSAGPYENRERQGDGGVRTHQAGDEEVDHEHQLAQAADLGQLDRRLLGEAEPEECESEQGTDDIGPEHVQSQHRPRCAHQPAQQVPSPL